MNQDQRVQQELSRLKRSSVRMRQGVVTAVDPIEITVGGGDVSVPCRVPNGDTYAVNDPVTVMIKQGDLWAVKLTDSPSAGAPGVTYSAGDGLDLSGTTFSTDLKSGGGLKIDATELAADFGSGAGKVTQGNDPRLSDQRVPTNGSVDGSKVAGSLKPSGTAAATDEALRRLGTGSTHAAAGDDARFPSAGEKNALAGSSGTPGSTNKYVTNNDSRLSDARTPVAHTQAASTITDFNTAVRTNRLDQMAAPTSSVEGYDAATGTQFVTRGQMEVADLAVTSGYKPLPDVDYIVASVYISPGWPGPSALPGARVGNVITESFNGELRISESPISMLGGSTLGIVPNIGDTLLLPGQSLSGSGTDNGIYVVTNPGSASTPWVLTRHPDFDTTGDLVQFNKVRSRNAGSSMFLSTANPITINTTVQTWEPYTFYPSEHALTHAPDGSDPIPMPDLGTYWQTETYGAIAIATATANQTYYSMIRILSTTTVAGIRYQLGTTSNGNVRSSIYDATGSRVANRTTNLAQGTVLQPQDVPFSSTAILTPGIYYAAMTFSSSSGTYIHAATLQPCGNAAGAGSGATRVSITPPTTSGNTPVLCLY